jgi:hypothetical protein
MGESRHHPVTTPALPTGLPKEKKSGNPFQARLPMIAFYMVHRWRSNYAYTPMMEKQPGIFVNLKTDERQYPLTTK